MRGVRSFIVLLVIAIPLGWYAWHESKKEPVSDKKQEKLFTGVDADKVDQVTIKSEKGERTTVAETGRQMADHGTRGHGCRRR